MRNDALVCLNSGLAYYGKGQYDRNFAKARKLKR